MKGEQGDKATEETLAALDALREERMAAETERLTQIYLVPDTDFPGLAWDPDGNPAREDLLETTPAREGANFPSPCLDWPLYSSDGQLSDDVHDAIMQGPLVLTYFRGCVFLFRSCRWQSCQQRVANLHMIGSCFACCKPGSGHPLRLLML